MHKQVPIVQPTAAFPGFPNHPENLLQPNEGIVLPFGFAKASVKASIFFSSCKNVTMKRKLQLSVFLLWLSQYLCRCKITLK